MKTVLLNSEKIVFIENVHTKKYYLCTKNKNEYFLLSENKLVDLKNAKIILPENPADSRRKVLERMFEKQYLVFEFDTIEELLTYVLND